MWPSRPLHLARGLVVLVATLLGAVGIAEAQGRPLRVTGTRDLTFGTLLPGVPMPVSRTDPARSGEFELRGEKFSVLQLDFVLPSGMAGPLGATMPLSFAATDGGFSSAESITAQTVFDPRAPAYGQLSKTGRATLFLGGTARPASNQRAGSYAASITLTVSYTGT